MTASHPHALTGAQRVTLETILARHGGSLTGQRTAQPTPTERDQLTQVLGFVLDVVQGAFLHRPHPAADRTRAKTFAVTSTRAHHKAIAADLDEAGYLTTSTYGRWSTSSVSDLLKP